MTSVYFCKPLHLISRIHDNWNEKIIVHISRFYLPWFWVWIDLSANRELLTQKIISITKLLTVKVTAAEGATVVVVVFVSVEFWLWATARKARNTTNSFKSERAIFSTLTDVPITSSIYYLYESSKMKRNTSFVNVCLVKR